MRIYLDSSAWVKRYRVEDGSEFVHRAFEGAAHLTSSILGHAEVTGALARRGVLEPASDWLARDLGDVELVEVSVAVGLVAAEIAGTFRLRGADATHLATMLAVQNATDDEVALVSADRELNAAAERLGLPVLDPTSG